MLATVAPLCAKDKFRSRFFRRCKGNGRRRQHQLRKLFVLQDLPWRKPQTFIFIEHCKDEA